MKLRDRSKSMPNLFETKSHSWAQVGLALQVSQDAARKARREIAVLIPAIAGVFVFYNYRDDIFGPEYDFWGRLITVVALLILGWAFARAVGRSAGPWLFRRLDPATAGTVGFLLRLLTIGLCLIVALRLAGLRPETLLVGGAFTAVVLGLAAQQTLGNLFAGTVLISARPFRVGERVLLQGGNVGGQIEGVVSSFGLLYTTLADGEDRIMVPNSLVLNTAVSPLREPDAVDLRARLPASVRPSEVQSLLAEKVTIRTRTSPHIALEELDGDEVVVRIEATPESPADGPRLADEILSAMASLTGNGQANGATRRRHEPPEDGTQEHVPSHGADPPV